MRLDTWQLFAPQAIERLNKFLHNLRALKVRCSVSDEAKADTSATAASGSMALLDGVINVFERLTAENSGSAFLSGETDADGLLIISETAQRLLSVLDGGLYLGVLIPRDDLTREMAECAVRALVDYTDGITAVQAVAVYREAVKPGSKLLTQLEWFLPVNVSRELTTVLSTGVTTWLRASTKLGTVTDVIKGYMVVTATNMEAYDAKCENYQRAQAAENSDAANALAKTRSLFINFLNYRQRKVLTGYTDSAQFIADFCVCFSLPATTDLYNLPLATMTEQFVVLMKAHYAALDSYAAPHVEIEAFRKEMATKQVHVVGAVDEMTLQYAKPPLDSVRVDRVHEFVKAACQSDASISAQLTELTGEPTAVTVTQDHCLSRYSEASYDETVTANLASIATLKYHLDTCYKSRPRGVVRGIFAPIDELKLNMINEILQCLTALERSPLDKSLIHQVVTTFHNVRFKHMSCVSYGKLSMGDMACALLLAQPAIHALMNSVNPSNDRQLHREVVANFTEVVEDTGLSDAVDDEDGWTFVTGL
ncbi:MAG: hypothetical protein P1U34_05670 [Coxiellaceae bacterium]|nr:hypothetical protein [Coxiellaceae bacterium]